MERTFHWPDFVPAFAKAAKQFGFASTTLVDTPAGPLQAWERSGEGPAIYLSAGIHGDEPAGPLALLDLMAGGYFQGNFHWLICPALNPTGLSTGTRDNDAGMDLNRDYRRVRSREVAAHQAWLSSQPLPALFLSLHEDWEAAGFYLYEINLGRDEPQRARGIIAAVRPWFEPESSADIDGHSPREPGWIYHEAEADVPEGWPEAIHLAKLGCPLSFTFETPSHALLADRVAAQCAATQVAAAGVASAGDG